MMTDLLLLALTAALTWGLWRARGEWGVVVERWAWAWAWAWHVARLMRAA